MTDSPPPTCGPPALLEEAVEHLRAYVRFDTTNPPGRETQAARHFLELLGREGIDAHVVEAVEGRGSLVARIPATRPVAGPLVLLHHADVVAAHAAEWSEDPFGAVLRDGYVYGRGAIDMKSVGIVHLMSFLQIHRRKVPLCRDLVLLLVADEETGGALGTGQLLEALPWLQTASLVLDEGGFILPRSAQDGGDLYCVSVAEKVPLHLLLHAQGAAGHGSVPFPGTATERVAAAVNRILQGDRVPRVHPVLCAYVASVAGATPGFEAACGTRTEGIPPTSPRFEEILRDPVHRSLFLDTVACTLLSAGNKINVIPSTATAGLDCRLLPDTCPEAFLETLRRLVKDLDVRMEPLGQESDSGVSPITGEFMDAVASCLREGGYAGSVVPYLMTGAADGRYFRRRGIPTYGFAPFRLSRTEQARIHGVDERISVENLAFGLTFFSGLVHKLVSAPPPAEE